MNQGDLQGVVDRRQVLQHSLNEGTALSSVCVIGSFHAKLEFSDGHDRNGDVVVRIDYLRQRQSPFHGNENSRNQKDLCGLHWLPHMSSRLSSTNSAHWGSGPYSSNKAMRAALLGLK